MPLATPAQQVMSTTDALPPGQHAIPRTTQPTLPSCTSPSYERLRNWWRLVRDVYAGTLRVQEQRALYLPQRPKEDPADWRRRAARAELWDAFGRTVRAMTGLVCQRDPELSEEVPKEIRGTEAAQFNDGDWSNIDRRGTNGADFIAELLLDGIMMGMNGVLVDAPRVNVDALSITLAEEKRRKIRPYWCMYRAEDIISSRYGIVMGEIALTQLVLREEVEVPVGDFGTGLERHYRVFRQEGDPESGPPPTPPIVEVTVWIEQLPSGGAADTVLIINPDLGGVIRNVTRIPFVPFICGTKLGPLEANPPLYPLAEKNIAHYTSRADLRDIQQTLIPILCTIGLQEDQREEIGAIGTNMALHMPPGCDAKWLEPTGRGVEPLERELDRIGHEMATLALAFLDPDQAGNAKQSATAHTLDHSAQNASLVRSVSNLQVVVERCLRFHCEHRKIPMKGTIKLNRDFERTIMEVSRMTELRNMEQAGEISLQTLWDLLLDGNALPKDFSPDDELLMLAANGTRTPDGGSVMPDLSLAGADNGDNAAPGSGGKVDTGAGGMPAMRGNTDKPKPTQVQAA